MLHNKARTACESLPATQSIKTLALALHQSPADDAVRLLLANTLLELGQPDAAEREYRAILQNDPAHLHVRRGLIRVLQKRDRWHEALKAWDAERCTFPNDLPVMRAQIECHLQLGNQDAALQAFTALTAHDACTPLDRYRKARLESQQTAFGLSVVESARWLDVYPDDDHLAANHAVVLRQGGRVPAALAFLQTRLQQCRDPINPIQHQLGFVHLALNNFHEAAQCFQVLVDGNPRDLHSVSNLARSQAAAGQAQAAIETLDACEGDQFSDVLSNTRSLLLSQAGEHRSAIRSALGVMRSNPNRVNLDTLCQCFLAAGEARRARYFTGVLERNFGHCADAKRQIATLWLRQKEYGGCIEWARKSLGVRPEFNQTLIDLSDALWSVGDVDEAWMMRLAAATADRRLTHPDNDRRQEALLTLDVSLRTACRQLDAASEPEQLLTHAKRLGNTLLRPHTIKAVGPVDHASRDFMQALQRVDVRTVSPTQPDHTLESLLENQLDALLARIPNPRLGGDLLLRCASYSVAVGRVERAIDYLERACETSKVDPLILRACQRQLAQAYGQRGKERLTGTVVLMVSCERYRERVERQALAMFRQTGRAIITLSATLDQPGFSLDMRDYGAHLLVPCDDGYLGLPRKMVLAYRYLFACTSVSGVMKLDDDVVVQDAARFESLVISAETSPADYIGWQCQFVDSTYHHSRYARAGHGEQTIIEHDPVAYASGGTGYYLSRVSLAALFRLGLTHFSRRTRRPAYEDVLVGEMLSRANIALENCHFPSAGGILVDVHEAAALRASVSERCGSQEPKSASEAEPESELTCEPVPALPSATPNRLTLAAPTEHVLVVTHGRSGSTLLQGVLNSIDQWCIKGENSGFAYHIYQSWAALQFAKSSRGDRAKSTENPWFGCGLTDLDAYQAQCGELIRSTLAAGAPEGTRCLGFKEIRYLGILREDPSGELLTGFLEFLTATLGNTRLVFLTREPADTVKSGWWRSEDTEESQALLEAFRRFSEEYVSNHATTACHIHYEQLIGGESSLQPLFDFLGTRPDPDDLKRVLLTPHSYGNRSFIHASMPRNVNAPNRPAKLAEADRLYALERFDDARRMYGEFIDDRPGQTVPFYAVTRAERTAYMVRTSDEHRLAYFPVPKCACTSISHLLYEIIYDEPFDKSVHGNVHKFFNAGVARLDLNGLEDYYKFAVVRDPIERFVSAYRNRILHHNDLEPNLNGRKPPTINEFVDRLPVYMTRNISVANHFQLQRYRLSESLDCFDEVFRFEELDRLARVLAERSGKSITLPHKQTGGPSMAVNDLSDRSLQKLLTFYADDYALLGELYSPDRYSEQARRQVA